jgi:hypothetical protein
MYRDDLAATYARVEQLQRDLTDASKEGQQDKARIASLTAQLAATQQALARMGVRPAQGYMFAPRATTVLVLGILSLAVCSVMGPIAWAIGSEELRRIDSGQTSPDARGSVTAGRICGIISTSLMILGVFMLFMMLAVLR